ncbi:MAG: hypothetical protein ABEJ64_02550, partial [Candidatus Nanohaloarchaea archaeon]
RYGNKIRKNVDAAETGTGECPDCGEELERRASGIWECNSCDRKVAGGAYEQDTGAEESLRRALQVGTEELEEAKEAVEDEGEE